MKRYSGRDFNENEIEIIRQLIADNVTASRRRLSALVCEKLNWRKLNGTLKDMSCRVALLRMQADGLITLQYVKPCGAKPQIVIHHTHETEAKTIIQKPVHELLQRTIFENVQKIYKLDVKGLIYDVTNTYLFGKKCSFAKHGKGKDGRKGKPIIQIGLGVTQQEGIPVFHKVYNGNIHDSRTFQDAITYFEEYKIKDGIFVFDRGITSKQAQIYIKKIKWKVLCGFSLTDRLKKIIKLSIKRKEFLDIRSRVRLNKTTFHVVQKKYKIGSIEGTLALCFNDQKKLDLSNSLYDEILNAQKLILNGKKIKPGLEKFFSKSGKLLSEKIVEEESLYGYSCIFTTAKLTTEEMVRHYFDKDLVEKAFQSIKGIVRLQQFWAY